MNIVVVYESMFGNTHQIAEAVADGAREAAPDAQVSLFPVAESDPQLVQAADLLVVGGPTHMRGMSSGMSRKMGISGEAKKDEAERHELEPGAEGPGMRDWFDTLPKATKRSKAAAFDTRADQRLSGGALMASHGDCAGMGMTLSPTRDSSSRTWRGRCGAGNRSGPRPGVPSSYGNRLRSVSDSAATGAAATFRHRRQPQLATDARSRAARLVT
jgi:Flavodoxin